MIYLVFIVVIMANSGRVVANIYDLTPEQEAILTAPVDNVVIFLAQVAVLSVVSSAYFSINVLTGILGIIWLLALAKALKEIIPGFPS